MVDLSTPESAMARGTGASGPAVSIDEASRPTISQTGFDNEAYQHCFLHAIQIQLTVPRFIMHHFDDNSCSNVSNHLWVLILS